MEEEPEYEFDDWFHSVIVSKFAELVVCEVVDSGYRVVSGHTSKHRVEVELQKARNQRIEDLKKNQLYSRSHREIL